MAGETDYKQALSEALRARADWLEKSELPKLKEELRGYHTGFASLYSMYLKKGLIREDPYKQESKISEIEVPDQEAFTEANRFDQLSLRLAAYDNQLDFLVNFYQFSPDFLSLDRIKRIAGLVKYIDWIHLSPDSQSSNTKAVAEMTNEIKIGSDSLTMNVISESLTYLNKCFTPIMSGLKTLSDYRRELYKLELRESVTARMNPAEAAQAPQIRKKFAQANPGQPFYPDLAEELIREDYTKEGPALREKVLKSIRIADTKPKELQTPVSFKSVLLEGILIIGSAGQALADIAVKMDENHSAIQNRKQGFWQKLKKTLGRMFNADPGEVVYDVEYTDPIKGVPVHERINFAAMRTDLDRKVKNLSAISGKGAAMTRLEAMREEQLISFLEKNIREVQSLHKILTALDEFFKTGTGKEDHEKVKGIKPELSTIKNAIIRANAKRHEFSAQKEEEEQLKRLGVNPGA
jgi:hypothetical protein